VYFLAVRVITLNLIPFIISGFSASFYKEPKYTIAASLALYLLVCDVPSSRASCGGAIEQNRPQGCISSCGSLRIGSAVYEHARVLEKKRQLIRIKAFKLGRCWNILCTESSDPRNQHCTSAYCGIRSSARDQS